MSLYERAKRHAQFMLAMLVLAIIFVGLSERFLGHSIIAFGIAALGLVLANARMLTFNCPNCGKNLFFRGMLVLPWPNRTCSNCGYELDKDVSE